MSGLEIFGAVVGGITLCAELSRLGHAVREAIQRLKNSRRDVLDLSDKAIIFAGLCTRFLHVYHDDHEAKSDFDSSIPRLIKWMKETEVALCKILQKASALLPDSKNRRSLEERCIARLEWFGSKKAVERLRASMVVASTSIDGFSNLICIQKLNEELIILKLALTDEPDRLSFEKTVGVTLEKKIEMIQQSIEVQSSVHYTKERVLREAMNEVVVGQDGRKTSDDLSVFTQTLKSCANRVLPANTPWYYQTLNTESGSSSESINEQKMPQGRIPRISDPNGTSDQSRTPHNTSTQPHRATASRVQRQSRSPEGYKIFRLNPAKQTSGLKQTMAVSPFHSLVEIIDMKSREYIDDPDGNILSQPKVKPPTQRLPPTKAQRLGRHTIMLSATEFRINDRSFGFTSYKTADDLFSAILLQRDLIDELVKVVNGGYGNVMWCGIMGWFASPGKVTRSLRNSGMKILQDGQRGA